MDRNLDKDLKVGGCSRHGEGLQVNQAERGSAATLTLARVACMLKGQQDFGPHCLSDSMPS